MMFHISKTTLRDFGAAANFLSSAKVLANVKCTASLIVDIQRNLRRICAAAKQVYKPLPLWLKYIENTEELSFNVIYMDS